MQRCTVCGYARADLDLKGKHHLVCGSCWKKMVQGKLTVGSKSPTKNHPG